MLIRLKDISKMYDKKSDNKILRDIDIEINGGDFLSILGKSGSGKTTLLNILGTIDCFDKGEYFIDEVDISKVKRSTLSKIRKNYFGFIFQSYQLINELTVKENVIMPMGYSGVSKKEREKRALDLLKELDLEGKENKFPNQLSGGEKQRVAIARAIANNPKVVLADEPTGNLDAVNTEIVMNIFKDLNKKGITIVMVTHDLSLRKYSNRTVLIEKGKLKEITI